MRIACGTILLFLLSVSSFAATCSPKIEDTLCKYLLNPPNSSVVAIRILLPQPPFSYPDKTKVSVDSMKNYGRMMLDSMQRNLTAMKPRIDSLFEKYVLYTLTTPRQRISPPDILYDYVLNVSAYDTTVTQLAEESLVVKMELYQSGVPVTTTTVPEFMILSTQFPFDTVLTGLAKVLPDNRIVPNVDTLFIDRYGLRFYFGRLPAPAWCCPAPIREDFWLSGNTGTVYSDIRYPMPLLQVFNDSIFLFMSGGQNPPNCNPPCTSFIKINPGYQSHEYRFQLNSATLYMKVTDADAQNTDSIKIRFDTTSFLSSSGIRNRSFSGKPASGCVDLVFENNFLVVRGIKAGERIRISIFDLRGRMLFASAINGEKGRLAVPNLRGKGVLIVKISTERGEIVTKNTWR